MSGRCGEEEASEDIQKLGGMEALDAPYMQIGFSQMFRKRAGWLAVLFLGEMLTATAMGYFEQEIAKAVVLALFMPLIISSGGNSGSQATTLVIRAMALGEVVSATGGESSAGNLHRASLSGRSWALSGFHGFLSGRPFQSRTARIICW